MNVDNTTGRDYLEQKIRELMRQANIQIEGISWEKEANILDILKITVKTHSKPATREIDELLLDDFEDSQNRRTLDSLAAQIVAELV